jgi:uridine phosphorylase
VAGVSHTGSLAFGAMPAAPVRLRPSAPLAERVLLPGDPHRALAVAQALLDGPKMFNHSRGLWGYSGLAADGAPLTIQSTGMGGPSAAIVTGELIALGARRLVRIGTCAALCDALDLGDLVAPRRVLAADGASAALGASGPLAPDPLLLERLAAAGARPAVVVSSDLLDGARAGWVGRGAVAVDMEVGALLQVAARHGVAAACVLAVTETDGGDRRASRERIDEIGLELGEAGYAALRTR